MFLPNTRRAKRSDPKYNENLEVGGQKFDNRGGDHKMSLYEG